MSLHLAPARRGLTASSPLLIAVVLGITAVAVWWSCTREIDAYIALRGFSPIAWVYQIAYPGNFVLNFPSGIENYRLSAFMHIYPAAFRLGISPETLLPVVVGVEIVLLSIALFALCRTLLPGAPLPVPALVIVYAIASTARDINLASFTQPYFFGQYYNVADALRILGLVMVLKSRPVAAAALLAASFATHPTMGLMGVVCAGAMQLTQPREILTRRFAAAAALFLLMTGAWLLVQFGGVTVSDGIIPSQVWREMTLLFNAHWYSVDHGFLTSKARQAFLPFLSFLLLLAFYWPNDGPRSQISAKALAGIVALLGITSVGLAISFFAPAPFLVKLALHRANDLVLLVGLVYVVNGLWRDLTADTWWRRALAVTALLSPWFVRPFPILVSVALSAPAWWRVLGRRGASAADWIVAALVLGAVLLSGLYFAAGIWTGISPSAFFRGPGALGLLALFLLVCALVARRFGRHVVQGVVVVTAFMLALSWSNDKAETRGVARERDYLRAQVWAREHTPGNALFMTDPTIYYGWRDYSRRSSFGNLREWLHTSWLYDSNFERYAEGLRRFGEFGIDLQPYLRMRPPDAAQKPLTEELKKRYYAASDEWRVNLAQRHGIDFFVFERDRMHGPTSLRLVYENENFMICAARK